MWANESLFGAALCWAVVPLRVFDAVIAQRYRNEIVQGHESFFRGAAIPDFFFMENNARPHIYHIVNDSLEEEDIRRIHWPVKSLDLNPIEHAWNGRRKAIGRRHCLLGPSRF